VGFGAIAIKNVWENRRSYLICNYIDLLTTTNLDIIDQT
jgi:hypothetical protein